MTDGIKAPKPKKKEINPLDPEQTKAFLTAICGDRLEALYVLAVHRGLRQGELLGLKWEDIDLEAGRLQVRRTLSLTKDGHVFEQPKNGKGRSVELTQAASDTLRSHLTRQLQEIEASGDEYQDQGLTPHRRDRVPEASCHVATLCQSGDFYRYASGNLRAAFPTLPDRSQFNRLVRFYSELIEEALALHLAEVSEARERPYQALDSSALDVRPGRQA